MSEQNGENNQPSNSRISNNHLLEFLIEQTGDLADIVYIAFKLNF